MRDIFSLSPISYQESQGNEYFSLKMQTYPYILWKRYTIEITFFREEKSNQFEASAQHTLWESFARMDCSSGRREGKNGSPVQKTGRRSVG